MQRTELIIGKIGETAYYAYSYPTPDGGWATKIVYGNVTITGDGIYDKERIENSVLRHFPELLDEIINN